MRSTAVPTEKSSCGSPACDLRIEELVHRDQVTGLSNRAQLQVDLEQAWEAARRAGRQIALLSIDLDDFKRVNDRHGQDAGDALLRAVADRLRTVVRPNDLLARQGGDEFLLLVRDVPEGASRVAVDMAGRVLGAFRAPFTIEGAALTVSASVGVSTYPRDAHSVDELLRHADHAMFVAKGGGKAGLHVHRGRDARVESAERSDSGFDPALHGAELERILDQRLIRALFQPIVAIGTRQTVGFEALARGPEGSPLERPDRMFATAAVTGATLALDWACRAAAVQAALDAGVGRTITLFVNCEPSAVDAPVPPGHAALWARATEELDLLLEITERALTDRPAELVREVALHRAAGRGIALDDIGADVRSLAVLPLVEPDVIKLDLRLVQDRPSTDKAAIVSAVAAEHERTGVAVLAEGIETEEHLAVARALGATLGQGWLWGRPGALPEATLGHRVPRARRTPAAPGATPYAIVAAQREVAIATKRLLLPISMHLEQQALRIGEGAVLMAAFQSAANFTPGTVRRYEVLARSASLVAAFGTHLPEEPCAGVRGAALAPDDLLVDEWSVVVLGPHFGGALVALDLGDEGPDRERRFTFATVYDRGLVIAAARSLVARIQPRVLPS
jgi:diguanylate cyclase (GGDEF)-like protein